MGERKIRVGLLIAISMFVVLAGASAARQDQSTSGSTSQNASGKTAKKDSATSGAAAKASADLKFMTQAAMGGMMEVELGRLATQRAASDDVKQFGQRMVDDHTKANDELMQLATTKGITLSTSMDAKGKAKIDKMSKLSGEEFDRAYMSDMVKDHQKDVALFQREADKGKDQDAKSFAAKTLPTLQEHLRMAQDINAKEHSKEHREGHKEGGKSSEGDKKQMRSGHFL